MTDLLRISAWLAMFAGRLLFAQQYTGAALQFSLDRSGPPPVQFTLTVDTKGNGTYAPHLDPTGAVAVQAPAEGGDSKALHVSPELVKKLFSAVPMVEGGRCETHNKGIAKTGVKMLRFTSPARNAQCTFNYSDDERVNEAESSFEALAETMQYGDRLRSKLRFDRLGLDSELDQLLNAVATQRALEVTNIAPVLQAITEDDRVMDRVRRKAARLLEGVTPAQAAAAVDGNLR